MTKLSLTFQKKTWKAILVSAPTQSRKTKKCFELLHQKICEIKGNVLVLFVTQANSLASAQQIIQRAITNHDILNIIPKSNIIKSKDVLQNDHINSGNYMVVDFWNSRNIDNMLTFVEIYKSNWKTIVIVIDEAEQGGTQGVKDRLTFIQEVEKIFTEIRVVFVTATVPNLSKSILQLAAMETHNKGLLGEIINHAVVEHHFAEPHESYVGASWFKEAKGVWQKLTFPKKTSDMSNDFYAELKERQCLTMLRELPESARELTLIVTSTRREDHKRFVYALPSTGYNVMVELNGKNIRNYHVHFITESGSIVEWDIPYASLDKKADKGDLKTAIHQKEDYTMSHVLQAALFMNTSAERRIREFATSEEFMKLKTLSHALMKSRPSNYPKNPRVALIAGHLAGRGITIQNPMIDFTCTSFCFTDSRDVVQRGAMNAQRFGRACGLLGEVFARSTRLPILIATENILKDAIANEMAVKEKAADTPNGSLISLKYFITKSDWDKIMRKINMCNKSPSDKTLGRDDAFDRILTYLYRSTNFSSQLSWKALLDHDIDLSNYLKSQNNWLINNMAENGWLIKGASHHWTLSSKAMQHITKIVSNP